MGFVSSFAWTVDCATQKLPRWGKASVNQSGHYWEKKKNEETNFVL